MANMNIVTGRSPTQADALVSADQVTIVGDGTKQNPIRAVGSALVLAPVIAAARVNSGYSFLSQVGFTGIVPFTPVGVYSLTLANPPADINNLVADAAQVGVAAGALTVAFGAPNIVTVFSRDLAGGLMARDLTVVVYDLTPTP